MRPIRAGLVPVSVTAGDLDDALRQRYTLSRIESDKESSSRRR